MRLLDDPWVSFNFPVDQSAQEGSHWELWGLVWNRNKKHCGKVFSIYGRMWA